MPRKSIFASSPAQPVEAALVKLGADLRRARLARRISMADIASRLGIDRRGIAAIERGDGRAPMAVVVGAMWIYGLDGRIADVADPEADAVGRALDLQRRPKTARLRAEDDF